MSWNDPFARPGCPQHRPGPARTPRPVQPKPEPTSRITIVAGRPGLPDRVMRRTTVELPFTELNPSMGTGNGVAYNLCVGTLETLSAHQRDVVLANLLAKFGTKTP